MPLTPKQVDKLVWLFFSLAGVTLICVVWAFILPMFAATGARNANVLGLALTYLVAVFGARTAWWWRNPTAIASPGG